MATAGRRKRVKDVVSLEQQMEEDAWKHPNVRTKTLLFSFNN